jgi:3-oxoacyl-[acyl-carrier protein] reductase
MSRSAPPWPRGHALLEGKTLVVTAAAGTGIGFVTARRAAEEGALVMISDFHERRLGESAAKLEELTGQKPATCLCDVTNQEQVDALIAAAVSELGHIDVLVNNAGLGGHARMAEMTDEQWHRVMDITLHGTMRMTRAVLPHMMERESGVIVNNASVHYAAAKAGVMALTRCVAIEAAEKGIRVNAVSPSIAAHEFLSKGMPDGLLAELAAREAFGRAAEPFEVANVIVFLASDYSTYMTGEVVAVSSQHP